MLSVLTGVLSALDVGHLAGLIQAQTGGNDSDLFGVEGLYSQQFSVIIFYFLIFCIVLFTGIVLAFMFLSRKKLKKGEIVLFIWIFLGIAAAVAFGAAQMLHGFLF